MGSFHPRWVEMPERGEEEVREEREEGGRGRGEE